MVIPRLSMDRFGGVRARRRRMHACLPDRNVRPSEVDRPETWRVFRSASSIGLPEGLIQCGHDPCQGAPAALGLAPKQECVVQ